MTPVNVARWCLCISLICLLRGAPAQEKIAPAQEKIAPAQEKIAPAQETNGGFQVRSKENAISTAEIIRRFEGPRVDSYTLGEGDEITIEVWNHPELSGKHVIGPDGKITVPVAGVLPVAKLSREDAQISIAKALEKFYADLSVTVRVDRYTSFRVFILGRVSSPGALQFETQPTLLDVVTRAGGLPIGGVGAEKVGPRAVARLFAAIRWSGSI